MKNENLDAVRGETLQAMSRNETWFKVLLGLCGAAELLGLGFVLWVIDWSDSTHRLIFAATMLVWVNLALWVWALAVRNRVGEQRVLRAVSLLVENDAETIRETGH